MYKPEDLYTVKTDKKEIIVTANHRFLTDRGWVKTNQLHIDRDNLVCVSFDDFLFSQSLVQSTLDTCLLTFEQGVRHYLRTILGFLYYCLQGPTLYGPQNKLNLFNLQVQKHFFNCHAKRFSNKTSGMRGLPAH